MREVPSIPAGLEPKLRNVLSAVRESLNAAIKNINLNTESLAGMTQWIQPALDSSTDIVTFNESLIQAPLESATGADGAAGINARAVTLTTPDQAFTYDSNGANPSPINSAITATIINTLGVVYYEFFLNDVSTGTATTSNVYTYTPQASFGSMPDKLEVQIREDSITGPIEARDMMTMIGLRAGAHGITVGLSNEAHTLPKTIANVVTYTGSGTKINVWEGATALTEDSSSPYANSTFRVTATGTSITPGAVTGTDTATLTYGDSSAMTTDPAKIIFTIIAKRADGTEITIPRQQSLSFSQQGATGSPGSAGGDSIDIVFVRAATQPDTPTASPGTPTAPITWYTDVASVPASANPLWASTGFKASASANYTWSTPVRIEGTSVAEVTVFTRGVPTTTPTGGTYTFSTPPALAVPTSTGATWYTSIPSGTTAVYTSRAVVSTAAGNTSAVAITGWTTPVISFQDGVNGTPGTSVYTGTIYKQITTATAPSGGTYNFSNGVLTAPDVSWSTTPPTTTTTPTWACDYTFSTTTPTISVSASTWTNLHIDMVKGDPGITGTRTAVLDLYQWGTTTAPTLFPSGTSTYTWGNGQFTDPATLNGWTKTPASPTAGQVLYVCHAFFADSLTTPTSPVTWSTTVAIVFTTAGTNGNAAAILSINNSAVTFIKGIDNVISPTTLALTTSVSNVTAPTYQWYKSIDGGSIYTAIASATASSHTIPSATDYASVTTITYKCIVTGTINGIASQTLNDAITIPLLSNSKSAVAVVLSNENITFPAPASNVPLPYSGITFTGGNCNITVYIGLTQLTYDANPIVTSRVANSFSCTNSSTGATVALGTGVTGGSTFAILAPTGMSDETGYTDVVVTIRDASNTALTAITKRINYSLSRAGVVGTPATYVTVTGEQAFKFATGSATPVSTSITLTAALTGGLTAYQWEYWNGTWVTLSGTVNASTYPLAYNNAAFTANSLRVRCISGTAFDEITIVKLYDGATGVSAVSGYLTNETVAVATDSNGNGAVYTSAGGTFKVFNGITDVTTSTAFTTTAAVSGLTLTIGAATGIYSVGVATAGTWTSDAASFTLTGVYNGTTITKVYKITKAKAGSPGGPGAAGDSVDIIFKRGADATTAPPITSPSTNGGTGWTTTVPAATQFPLWSSTGLQIASTGNYTWQAPVKIEGANVAEVTLYTRTFNPPVPTGATYTFGIAAPLVPATLSIWSVAIPIGTAAVYTSRAVVSAAAGYSSAVSITGWTTPVISLQNGTDGRRVGFLELYKWSTAAPTTYPNGTSTYNWSDGTFTSPLLLGASSLNGWALVPATAVAGQSLWGISATISNTSTTATDTATWSSTAPYVVGYAGGNGVSTNVLELYSTSATALIGTTTYTYDFSSDNLTSSTNTFGNWSRAMPATTTTATYMTTCSYSVTAPTPSLGKLGSAWSTPIVVAQNGAPGGTGGTGPRATFTTYATYATAAAWDDATAYSAITAMTGSGSVLLVGDEVTLCYPDTTAPTYVLTKYVTAVGNPGTWAARGKVIDGNLLVTGSVKAAMLQAGVNPLVSGTTMSGQGGIINSDGTFALGNPVNSTTGIGANISYNGTTLTLNGNVVGTGNIKGNAITDYWSAAMTAPLAMPTPYNQSGLFSAYTTTFTSFTVPIAGELLVTIHSVFHNFDGTYARRMQCVHLVNGVASTPQYPILYLNAAGPDTTLVPIGPSGNTKTQGTGATHTSVHQVPVTANQVITISIKGNPAATNTGIYMLDGWYVATLLKK